MSNRSTGAVGSGRKRANMPKPKDKPFAIPKLLVWEAWRRVRANKGAPGVDGQDLAQFEADLRNNLYKIWNRMSSGTWFPPPVMAVEIPKPHGGGVRVLGVPTIADRVAQTVVAMHLEERADHRFHPDSHGYRPNKSAHRALAACRQRCWKYDWAIDLDVQRFLEPSSHCLSGHGGGVEEGGLWLWDEDSEAFSASVADVQGVEFAALDTLQHGLAGDAEGAHRVDDRDVSGWGVFDEQGAELIVDADPPGRAGGVLFAGDESVGQPAVDRGGRDLEDLGGAGDRQELAVGRVAGWLVARDLPVAAQAGDDLGGESLSGGRAAALAVEDSGDRGVVVVDGEPTHQRDGVVVGADRGLVSWQRDGQFGDRAALPAQRQRGAAFFAHDIDDHLLDQATDQLLAVAVGGGRRGPHAPEVGAERQQPLALGLGEGAWALLLAQHEFGLGLGELLQRG